MALAMVLIGIACVGMKQYDKASEFLRYAMLKWPGLPNASPPLTTWLGGTDGFSRLLKALEDENRKLKKLLAESMLDISALKELLSKKW